MLRTMEWKRRAMMSATRYATTSAAARASRSSGDTERLLPAAPFDRNVQLHAPAVPEHAERRARADPGILNESRELRSVRDRDAVEPHDDVAGTETAGVRGRVAPHAPDQNAP